MFPKKNEDILFCPAAFHLMLLKRPKFKAALYVCKNEMRGEKKPKGILHFFLLRQLGLSLQQKTRQKSNSSRNPRLPLTHTFFRG